MRVFTFVNIISKRATHISGTLYHGHGGHCLFTVFHQELLLGAREEAASIFLGYNNWWQMLTQASYFMKITEHSPFTHLWYLGVEMELLVVWPLLFYFIKMDRAASGQRGDLVFCPTGSCLCTAMGLMYHADNVNRVYYGTDTRAFSFDRRGLRPQGR